MPLFPHTAVPLLLLPASLTSAASTISPHVRVVVAAWRESLNFVEPMLKLVPRAGAKIYCAGGELEDPRCTKIPNYGHESYAYLKHIVDNYEQGLAPITVFSMGSVWKRWRDFLLCRKLNYVLATLDSEAKQANFSGYETMAHEAPGHFLPFHDGFAISEFRGWSAGQPRPLCPASVGTLAEWYQKFVDKDLSKARLAGVQFNGIFAVSRERLHSRPKALYEALLHEVERCGLDHSQVAGHFLERTWKPMLDHHRPGEDFRDSGPNECPIKELIDRSGGLRAWPGWSQHTEQYNPGVMLLQGEMTHFQSGTHEEL